MNTTINLFQPLALLYSQRAARQSIQSPEFAMYKIAINGFGRIGRCILRAYCERKLNDTLQIVAINDTADASILAHLTRNDSTHGHFNGTVELQDGYLVINGQAIQLLNTLQPASLPWSELSVDMLLECSGASRTRNDISPHLEAGADRVLVSHPVPDADITVVYGVNHHQLAEQHRIISNASCTTNCIAPLLQVLNDNIGIATGAFTTVHSYTNDQHLLDQPHGDPYRSRAAALSMIPTKTGAAAALEQVLPELAGRVTGIAVRVPTPNVSLTDFHFVPEQKTSKEAINHYLKLASEQHLKGILNYSEEPLVSADYNHDPASCTVDGVQTSYQNINTGIPDKQHCGQARVMAWYDNEWGFANRMLDIAMHLAQTTR